jgi:hypothetical protein
MAVVQSMSGIIAKEVGQGLGMAVQNVTRAGPAQAGSAGASEETKPYTQNQVTTLLGFHRAMNVGYLKKVWWLFKSTKIPNYDHLLHPSRLICTRGQISSGAGMRRASTLTIKA